MENNNLNKALIVNAPKSPLKGSVTIPADKSISHRSAMFGALTKGEVEIKNFSKELEVWIVMVRHYKGILTTGPTGPVVV